MGILSSHGNVFAMRCASDSFSAMLIPFLENSFPMEPEARREDQLEEDCPPDEASALFDVDPGALVEDVVRAGCPGDQPGVYWNASPLANTTNVEQNSSTAISLMHMTVEGMK